MSWGPSAYNSDLYVNGDRSWPVFQETYSKFDSAEKRLDSDDIVCLKASEVKAACPELMPRPPPRPFPACPPVFGPLFNEHSYRQQRIIRLRRRLYRGVWIYQQFINNRWVRVTKIDNRWVPWKQAFRWNVVDGRWVKVPLRRRRRVLRLRRRFINGVWIVQAWSPVMTRWVVVRKVRGRWRQRYNGRWVPVLMALPGRNFGADGVYWGDEPTGGRKPGRWARPDRGGGAVNFDIDVDNTYNFGGGGGGGGGGSGGRRKPGRRRPPGRNLVNERDCRVKRIARCMNAGCGLYSNRQECIGCVVCDGGGGGDGSTTKPAPDRPPVRPGQCYVKKIDRCTKAGCGLYSNRQECAGCVVCPYPVGKPKTPKPDTPQPETPKPSNCRVKVNDRCKKAKCKVSSKRKECDGCVVCAGDTTPPVGSLLPTAETKCRLRVNDRCKKAKCKLSSKRKECDGCVVCPGVNTTPPPPAADDKNKCRVKANDRCKKAKCKVSSKRKECDGCVVCSKA